MALAGFSGGTIRSRLLLIVIGALLPVALLSAWQGKVSYDNARRLVTDRLRANAWGLAESERDSFIIARHAMIFAGQSPAVRDITDSCTDILRSALMGANGVINFVRTDAEGKARCSVLPFTPGEDLSRDKWWLESLGKTGIIVASPQFGRISRQPVIILVHPLHTAEGKFIGNLSAGVSLERLSASLQRKQGGNRSSVFIVNRAGVPVLQTQPAQFSAVGNVALALTEPLEFQANDGSAWTFVAAPLFANDLFVVYAEPNKAVMATQAAQTRNAFALQVLTLLLTSLAIWYGSKWLILRWLNRLQRLTAQFARGDFTGERAVYADAPEEITELSDRLHDMGEAIAEHERQLRSALAVESALTREVHHRVKNNLQIVTSLLTLQSERLADPLAREVVGQARARIGALGLIHRLLYEEQRGSEQGSVNMQVLLGELCAQLRSANRQRADITLECDAQDSALPVDAAVPVTLFTVEAITNGYRHAFERGVGGTIRVNFAIKDTEAMLRISDDGSGFLADAALPQMGLDLMQAFTTQLNGAMKIESSSSGAQLTLNFSVGAAD